MSVVRKPYVEWLLLLAACLACGSAAVLGNDRDEMFAAYRRGEALRQQGNFTQAATEYVRALQLSVRIFGPESVETATLRNNFGLICSELGKFDDAESLYRQSLAVREKVLGPNHVDVAQTLNNLGSLYRQTNRQAQAIGLFERSLAIREARYGPNHAQVSQSLNQLGSVYQDLGQTERAEAYFLRALQIGETSLGPRHLETAASLNNLGLLYAQTGQPGKAVTYYERSLKILADIFRPEHPRVAASLNNLGSLYTELGQFDKAEDLFTRSLKISEATLPPGHPSIGRSINNLANVYYYKKEYAKAEALYKRSIQNQETTFGADSPQTALGLANLATLYSEIKRPAEAVPLFERSNDIAERKLGPEHPELAGGLLNLANCYRMLGRYAAAEPLYDRSIKIFQLKYGPDHPRVAAAVRNYAVLLSRKEQFAEAAEQFDRARRIMRRYNVTVLPALTETEQITFLKNMDEDGLHVALSFAWRHPQTRSLTERSAGWVLNGKGVSIESLAERSLLARDASNPAVAALAQELAAVRRELAGLMFVAAGDEDNAPRRKRLAELGRREQQLSLRLNRANVRRATDEPWVEPSAVREAVPADGVLVELMRLRPIYFSAAENETRHDAARYVAWILPPAGKGEIKMLDLGPAAEIDAAVEALGQEIKAFWMIGVRSDRDPEVIEQEGEQALRPSAGALAKLVLQPLVRENRRRQAADLEPGRGPVADSLGGAAAGRRELFGGKIRRAVCDQRSTTSA